MKKYIATALLPLLLAMSACGTATAPADENTDSDSDFHGSEITLSDGTENYMPKIRPDTAVEVEISGDNLSIYTVTVNDKTCYVTGYGVGGIWCEDATTTTETPDGFE